MITQQTPGQITLAANTYTKARLYGAGCHLSAGIWASALSWLVVHQLTSEKLSFTPVDTVLCTTGVCVPLGIWLAGRKSHPFVTRQYREVLNFQIAIALNTFLFSILSYGYLIVALLSTGEICGEPGKSATPGLDPVTHPVIGFFTLLVAIRLIQVGIASWKALGGKSHRYSFILHWLR